MSKYFPNFFFLDSALSCRCWLVFPQGLQSVLPHIASDTHKTRHRHRIINQNIVITLNFFKNNETVAILHRLDALFKSHVIHFPLPCRIQPDVYS